MEKLMDEVNLKRCDDYYTPESLAWDLLVGDIDDVKVGKLMGFSPSNKNENENKHEMLTFQFEILITIFMEILFNIAKLDFHDGESTGETFIPQYDKFNINAYSEMIKDKFKLLGYCVIIISEKIDNFSNEQEDFKYLINNRYCRVLLKHNSEEIDEQFDNFPEDTYYHMKINGLNKNIYNNLWEIYCVFFMNDIIFTVSFQICSPDDYIEKKLIFA